MKKSNFIALVMGTVSGVLFALGMCMALLPEWNAFVPGVVMGCAGAALSLVTWLVWRKMENKKPIHLSRKTVLAIALGVVGALVLGLGMCCCMMWNKLVAGILIGIVGIVMLLCLIPLTVGLKK